MSINVTAYHVEFHDTKSDKFWRCYRFHGPDRVGIWVRHWGPCGASVGQYKLAQSSLPNVDAMDELYKKIDKGYGDQQARGWYITEGFMKAIKLGKGLPDLGYQFNQHLGGKFETPLDEVIADLQGIRLSLER